VTGKTFSYKYPVATPTNYCPCEFISTSLSFLLTILSPLPLHLIIL
jgi:hypothetical protein